jgi:oxaloacetate decarboxylase gamma subunit
MGMQVSDLMMDGAQLMLLGMGSVFIFLTILVMTMKVMSWLAITVGSKEEVLPKRAPVRNSGVDANIIPVIAAAVAVWRKRHH